MTEAIFLKDVMVILGAAVLVVTVLYRLRTNPIVGYLIAGALIGPHAAALVTDVKTIHAVAELGVVFLFFTIGLELPLERLMSIRRFFFTLGALQVFVTAAILAWVTYAFGASIEVAIIVGGGLAFSSSAFCFKLLEDKQELGKRSGRVATAVLLFQDIAVVPFLALIPLLGSDDASLAPALGLAFFKSVVAIFVIIIVGRLALRPLYRVVSTLRNPELFTALTILVILGIGSITHHFELSMALGAFCAGLLLAETEFLHQVEADILPFRGMLIGLFFMSVGMSLDLSLLAGHMMHLVMLLAGLLAIKILTLFISCLSLREDVVLSAKVSFLLSQSGEFAFVLFGTAMAANVLDVALGNLLLAVVTLSMVVTPLMARAGDYLSEALQRFGHKRRLSLREEVSELEDHILIAGFGRGGQTVAKLLESSNIPFVALDLDGSRVAQAHARGIPVFYGDVTQMGVLMAAGVARAKAVVVTLDHSKSAERSIALLHRYFPNLKIYARARDKAHGKRLEAVGATELVLETFEANLQLGSLVLTTEGLSSPHIKEIIEEFRKDDYELLDELVKK